MKNHEMPHKTLSPDEQFELNRLHREATFTNNIIAMLVEKRIANKENDDRVKRINELLHLAQQQLADLEFAMQDVLGFEQNADKHTWWMRNIYCKCPWLDNTDPMYFGSGRIVNDFCPVHGTLD